MKTGLSMHPDMGGFLGGGLYRPYQGYDDFQQEGLSLSPGSEYHDHFYSEW